VVLFDVGVVLLRFLTMPQKKIYPPGYGGFVPGIAAGNMHGMTFGSILSKDNLRIANKRAQLSAERLFRFPCTISYAVILKGLLP
jgi:hypothetical protein